MKIPILFFFIGLITVFQSCESKPRMIVADTGSVNEDTSGNSTGNPNIQSLSQQGNTAGMDGSVHRVTLQDFIQTDRYTYMQVKENGRTFWIATSRMDPVKGRSYIYRGGLMKTGFESQEFKRTFDTIYLVGQVLDESRHPGGNMASGDAVITTPSTGIDVDQHSPDAVKLSDLFANKQKYDGQHVTVEGKVVKVNNGIMGRNWVHLQDGSKVGGKVLDITVTTNKVLQPGTQAALHGKVTLNKDFGAGYRYDVIVEEE